MLYGILSENDLRKHGIPEGGQGLRGYLILVCETAFYHFLLRPLN
ncbi:hypothetical protein SAMN04487898_108139 [Pedobacter sp. ok626]|nr:hypothetical protein SAMN04487898_108139 [Pedobacter sp. ok626]